MTTSDTSGVTADEFAERLFQSALGAFETLSVYIGDRLGWYRALAEEPATAAELAARTSTHPRYAAEWLEHQAVCGIVETDPRHGAAERRYTLAAGPREALTDTTSLAYLGSLPRMLGAVKLPALLEAYRTGGGVSWDELGDDARTAQAEMNRPWFERELPGALSAAPEVHDVCAEPGARILDVGCGFGWSALALARTYPEAEVVGVDIDGPSIAAAREHAVAAGLADRVRFEHADGVTLGEAGTFDAAFAFECVHDMPQPVDVLRAVGAAVRPDGVVVVMDEAVADEFTVPGDDLERLMYGFSLFVCLPDSMSHRPTVATGTVMRPATLQKYAREAGFREVEVLPVGEFGFFRFYSLVP